ncbi:hypothetical protein YC2023_095933 [Brassica napus]
MGRLTREPTHLIHALKALSFSVIVCCREIVPAQSGETAEESSDVERRAAAAVASTLESEEPDNGGGYIARSLIKSSSISGSKCIGVQSKTDKEFSGENTHRVTGHGR